MKIYYYCAFIIKIYDLGLKNMERFTNLHVILAQGPC